MVLISLIMSLVNTRPVLQKDYIKYIKLKIFKVVAPLHQDE